MLKDVLYLETQRKGLVKHMKKITDKQLLMGADFAGFPLKEAIKEYLEKRGGQSRISELRQTLTPMIPS